MSPASCPTPIPAQCLPPSDSGKDNDNPDDDDSGLETEQEWLDESELTELARKFPSKMSEAMAIEVRQNFFFFHFDLHMFL